MAPRFWAGLLNYLENILTQRQTEIQTLTEEMNEDKEKMGADYKQKLANIESILKKEMANQNDLMNELKQNKEIKSQWASVCSSWKKNKL